MAWEYQSITMNIMTLAPDESLTHWLNEQGRQDWELVTIVRDGYQWTAVFKRHREETSDA